MKRQIMCLILLFLLTLGCLPVRTGALETGVPAGGIHILKTSVRGDPLEGAVFEIARELREGELTDQNVDKKILKIEDENRIMAMETFWDNRAMTGEKQTEVITDASGNAAIYGLPYGTYYLVETIAPDGYNRIIDPIRVTIHKYSHLTEKDGVQDDQGIVIDNTLHIINVRYTLPDTGNLGTLQLAAGGTGVLFSSAALLLLNRRRWR